MQNDNYRTGADGEMTTALMYIAQHFTTFSPFHLKVAMYAIHVS